MSPKNQKYPVYTKHLPSTPKNFWSISLYDETFSRYKVVENRKCTKEKSETKHGFAHHGYADDNQFYITFKPIGGCIDEATFSIECCVRDIRRWLTVNFLELNDKKTEFIVFAPKRLSHHAEEPKLNIG